MTRNDPATHDPQQLDFAGKVKALLLMGRPHMAGEVPIWTLFGCVLSSQIHTSSHSAVATSPGVLSTLDWFAALQCAMVTWITGISINFSNDYFDWELDHPEHAVTIKSDVEKRNAALKAAEKAPDPVKARNRALRMKTASMKSGGRVIHDGTFPPYIALICSAACQLLVMAIVYTSRGISRNPLSLAKFRPGHAGTPFQGLPLLFVWIGSFFAQEYIAPPLKLHYRGFGEVLSAVWMAPFSTVFGLTAHYTAATGHKLTWGDTLRTFDSQMWTLLLGLYFYEQARILVMHIADLDLDRKGGKRTLVTRIGHAPATRLYGILNILACGTFCYLALQLGRPGSITRVPGGHEMTRQALKRYQSAFTSGLSVIAGYYLPVAITTYNSLRAADPKKNRQQPIGKLPRIPAAKCAILVSIQLLVSPWFFCATVLTASKAARATMT